MLLQGRTAFVTGGSGAVGSAIVRTFAAEGARVAFTYHDRTDKAQVLADELQAGGATVRAYPLDVLDGKASQALDERVEKDLGPVDALVNNAGIAQVMPFALIEEEDWDLTMDVNVKGTFLVTKAFLRGMIRRKRGSIVNLGSLAGMRILEVPVHYATAKAAIMGFTISLAREIARYNIRVNAVIPGMLSGGVGLNVPDRQKEEYKKYCTMGRVGTPEEVAKVIAFLASDHASYVNAQGIYIDGGI